MEESVVNDGMPNQEEPTPQEEQETTDSEVVENAVTDIQGNLRIALQKERQRRKDAEAQLRQVQYQDPENEDETVKRFLDVEATTLVNNRLLTDPSFKDRADLVQSEMKATGKTLEDADNAVIARLFRDMTSGQFSEENKSKPIKQIPTTAIPEATRISKEDQEQVDLFDRMAKSFGK